MDKHMINQDQYEPTRQVYELIKNTRVIHRNMRDLKPETKQMNEIRYLEAEIDLLDHYDGKRRQEDQLRAARTRINLLDQLSELYAKQRAR